MNNGLDPSVYVTRPYAPAATRLRAFIAYLREIPRAARQIRANLRTPLPVSFIDYGKSAFGGFADYYPGDGTARLRRGPGSGAAGRAARRRARRGAGDAGPRRLAGEPAPARDHQLRARRGSASRR